jgi:hypothetical protein
VKHPVPLLVCCVVLASFSIARSEDEPIEDAVIQDPPNATLITKSAADAEGMATVTGTAGAVDPDAIVGVACLDTAWVQFVQAETDGSFSARLFAPDGSHVQVKHALPFIPFPELAAVFGGTQQGDISAAWHSVTTGVILPPPAVSPGGDGSLDFALAGDLMHEGGLGYWMFTGTQGPLEGENLPISGTLRFISSALTSGFDTSSVGGQINLQLNRLFDATGRQLPVQQVVISNLMTPTGFPISRDGGANPITHFEELGTWSQPADHVLETQVNLVMHIPGATSPGWYRLLAGVQTTGVPIADSPDLSDLLLGFRPGVVLPGSSGNGFLPLFRIGEPTAPRLTWMLLTDTLYEATRGVVAREDLGRIGLIPLTSFQNTTYVVPRDDARTGLPLRYRLEPFLPLVSMTDRGVPVPPLVPFDLPSGSLVVTVDRPDGSRDTLGPAPFAQSRVASPGHPHGQLRDNDGGAVNDVYQLTTMADDFAYRFETYGHHVVTLSGTVDDIWGNSYHGGGTYDVMVARPLKLTAGSLPTTPFEDGDTFAPTVQIAPAVPAEVEIRCDLMVDSDPTRTVSFAVQGHANRFGWFDGGRDAPPWTFEAAGEYRVDVTATFEDARGTLWVGGATWGGVVAPRAPQLVAHGRHGLDDPDWDEMTWFFHGQLGVTFQAAHTYYPFHTGDIFWGAAADDFPETGGDAILPMVTFQDTVGTVQQIVESRWDTHVHTGIWPDTLQDRIAKGELPLVSTTVDGTDARWSPDQVEQWGYGYRTSQRPGARVHETVAEVGTGIAYWRYDATYGDQVGVEGDLPNDLKWQFGSVVFRVPSQDIAEYGVYGTLWVLVDDDDPLGPRVTPPFQGVSGGPNGGPILSLEGEDVDLLFLARSGAPGQLLVVGERLVLSGHVGPPLPSLVDATVTSPSGVVYTVSGRANRIGYFHAHDQGVVVEEPGAWTVELEVEHDGDTSAGPTPAPYPTGGVLGAENRRYSIYVASPGAGRLRATRPGIGFVTIDGSPIEPIDIEVAAPPAGAGGTLHYAITAPGLLLEQGEVIADGGSAVVTYDPQALHADFPNLDLTAYDRPQPGLADDIRISLLWVDRSGRSTGGVVDLRGEEVLPTHVLVPRAPRHSPVRVIP